MGGGKNGGNSASNAEQTALNNQGQLNTQMLGQANQLASNNSQYYQPLLGGLSSDYNAVSGNGTLGQNLSSGLNSSMASGGNMLSQTGVNPNTGLQQLTSYAGAPSSTNLSQATPGLQQYYQNEQQNGINPQYAQNAQNQLAQASAGGMTNMLANAAPGTNVNAMMQNNQSQLLQNSANLQGNLAGQSQNFSNTGAQGVANTATNADTQKLGMLQAGNTAGQQGNTQTLQNLLSTLAQGQSSLNSSNAFAGQGTASLEQAMNALSGLSSQNAAQATQFGNQAQQQQQGKNAGIGSTLGGIGSLFLGGTGGTGGTSLSSAENDPTLLGGLSG